ncbi:periodic tryptophan protein 1 like [Fagus crenata]
MDVDAAKEAGEVAQALEVADALGRTSNIAKSKTSFDNIADGLRELDMENYDEEDDGMNPICLRIELFSSGLGDIYYRSNDLDPYLKDKDDEDSEDAEDMTINPTDVVLVCARSGEDVSQLEVWIYEESDDGDPNVYVHHDIIISANLLCTARLDCPLKGGEKGNFIAVGSMEPSIEIWDLDIVQAVAWNHHAPQVILTGSFDRSIVMSILVIIINGQSQILKQVKLWDLSNNQPSCIASTNPKAGAVFSVSFSEDSPFLLAIGGSKGNLEVSGKISIFCYLVESCFPGSCVIDDND